MGLGWLIWWVYKSTRGHRGVLLHLGGGGIHGPQWCLDGWYGSSSIQMNSRIQDFPAEHCMEGRWWRLFTSPVRGSNVMQITCVNLLSLCDRRGQEEDKWNQTMPWQHHRATVSYVSPLINSEFTFNLSLVCLLLISQHSTTVVESIQVPRRAICFKHTWIKDTHNTAL